MGGKFRVKAEGGGHLQAPHRFCAGTGVESMNRRVFSSGRSVPDRVKLFFAWQIGCDYRQ
jgi:hypothetical protein